MAEKMLKSVTRSGDEIRIHLADGVTEFLSVEDFKARAAQEGEHDHVMAEICADILAEYPELKDGPGGLGDIRNRRYTRKPMGKQ